MGVLFIDGGALVELYCGRPPPLCPPDIPLQLFWGKGRLWLPLLTL